MFLIKESACSARDPGSITGSGRSPGEGNGNLLQYSCLENSRDRGACWATVHGVAKSWTPLKKITLCFQFKIIKNNNRSIHCILTFFLHLFNQLGPDINYLIYHCDPSENGKYSSIYWGKKINSIYWPTFFPPWTRSTLLVSGPTVDLVFTLLVPLLYKIPALELHWTIVTTTWDDVEGYDDKLL